MGRRLAARLRRTVSGLILLVLLVVLSPILLVGYLVWSPIATRAARRAAQITADRLFPGEVRVTGARGCGEAGGYAVSAELVADPSVRFRWTGERRCGDGRCDAEILSAVANARDGAAERAALARAFDAHGLALSGEPEVLHRPTHSPAQPRSISAVLSISVPTSQLDGPGAQSATAQLEAAVVGWPSQRVGLLAVSRYVAIVYIAGPTGRPRNVADILVEDGIVRTARLRRIGAV